MRRAERTIDASGLRIGARLSVEEALARVTLQPAATAVWVELDRDCGDPMDNLLIQVSHDVSRRSYGAVVSATTPLLDRTSARITDDDVELIIEADEAERTTALALAIARKHSPLNVHDIGADKNAERLRQLSEEVSRIASTLARLSAEPAPSRPSLTPVSAGEVPPLSADVVANVIRARRLRSKFFSDELFADPAWDMLLDLLQSEIRQLRVPVSSLCIAASVPATTALRWLKTLVSQGLFVRRADPQDGRRVFVELAPETSLAMRRYFGELGPVAVI
jgi:DNA-binding MarR family transcriptional regulator